MTIDPGTSPPFTTVILNYGINVMAAVRGNVHSYL